MLVVERCEFFWYEDGVILLCCLVLDEVMVFVGVVYFLFGKLSLLREK